MRKMVLLTIALALALTPAAAQIPTNVDAINPCVRTSDQAVTNLVACGMSFTPAGAIQFTVKNLGTVGFNVGAVTIDSSGVKKTAPTGPPAQIDVYMQNARVASSHLPSLAGNATKTITVPIPSNYTKPGCGESRTLKLVVDATSVVAEASEGDNTVTSTRDRPCPDMAIEYINKNWNDLHTEFVAKIKIVNKGNADARFKYLALTSNSSAFGPLPSATFDKWMEIPAGGSKTFNIGNAFSTSKMYVRVHLDRWGEVDELYEDNNFKEETLNN